MARKRKQDSRGQASGDASNAGRCGRNRYWSNRDFRGGSAGSSQRECAFVSDVHAGSYALAEWLKQCGVKTVAMESTGVYWIPLFQILEERGFEVYLVNARHVKNVPGRRTDVSDGQWLQFLHSVGLLRASYRPEQEVCAIRSLLRHRESLVQMAATHVNHMQKALDQMNLQLHHVISDITGQTGLAIVDAILGGERNPQVLAKLRHERIKASEEVIAKSLVGDYRPEHLFTLRQSLMAYRSYQDLIADCEREIRQRLGRFQPPNSPQVSTSDPAAGSRSPKTLSSDGVLRAELKYAFGVDLTQIPGIRTGIAQTLFGEIGPDFSKFRSASAFASWMGLCPDNEISGGKVLWVGTRKVNCRAATGLAHGGSVPASQQICPRRLLSPHAREAGCTEGYYRGGPQIGTHHFPLGELPIRNSMTANLPRINSASRSAKKQNFEPKPEPLAFNSFPWNRHHQWFLKSWRHRRAACEVLPLFPRWRT